MKTLISIMFAIVLMIYNQPTNSLQGFQEIEVNTDTSISETHSDDIDWSKYNINKDTNLAYNTLLSSINERKLKMKKDLEQGNISIDSIGKQFCHLLVNSIFPHWYGTPWAFEGHTNIPNKGEVACGYFVSTTLKHMGANLNRYKMAQQASLLAAKSIEKSANIISLPNKSRSELIEHVEENLKEGIYIIALDFHIGFLLYQKNEVFFIHSNFFDPSEVVVEMAYTSEALLSTNSFYLAAVSNNKEFMRKWLNHTPIVIKTS